MQNNKWVNVFDHVDIKRDGIVILKNIPIKLNIIKDKELNIEEWKGTFTLSDNKAMLLSFYDDSQYEIVLSNGKSGVFDVSKATTSLDVNVNYRFEGVNVLK